jgi:ABC-type amino acid transport substrate-binding protein
MFDGSPTWARTRDLRINSPALYRLSYRGIERPNNRHLGGRRQEISKNLLLSDGGGYSFKAAPSLEIDVTAQHVLVRASTLVFKLVVCTKLAFAIPFAFAEEKNTWLGLPVEFGKQSYAFKNGPAIELEKPRVLTTSPVEFSRAWVVPDWADWITHFSTRKVHVVAGGIVAKPSSLARLGFVDGPSSKIVTKLEFSSLKLLFGDTPLTLPAGDMQFAPDGALARVRVGFEGGVNLELVPREGGRLGVLLQTGTFKTPVLEAFRFDSVVAQGEMSDDQVVLDRIGTSGDGGSLSGVLRLVSAGKFLLEGNIKMDGIRAKGVLDRLYPRAVVDGILSGNFKISTSADSFEGLGKTVAVEGSYVLKSGALDRFGLLEGMRRSGSGVVGGGVVRFDQISGKFSGRTGAPAQAGFVDLVSGALKGSSSFSVDPSGALRGSARGSLSLPGGEMINRSFTLAGKADAPTLIAP